MRSIRWIILAWKIPHHIVLLLLSSTLDLTTTVAESTLRLFESPACQQDRHRRSYGHIPFIEQLQDIICLVKERRFEDLHNWYLRHNNPRETNSHQWLQHAAERRNNTEFTLLTTFLNHELEYAFNELSALEFESLSLLLLDEISAAVSFSLTQTRTQEYTLAGTDISNMTEERTHSARHRLNHEQLAAISPLLIQIAGYQCRYHDYFRLSPFISSQAARAGPLLLLSKLFQSFITIGVHPHDESQYLFTSSVQATLSQGCALLMTLSFGLPLPIYHVQSSMVVFTALDFCNISFQNPFQDIGLYQSHSVLWLSADELNHLQSKVSTAELFQYILHSMQLSQDEYDSYTNSFNLSHSQEFYHAESQLIRHLLEKDLFSNYQVRQFSSSLQQLMINAHTRLSVFWDEFGDFLMSKIHHKMATTIFQLLTIEEVTQSFALLQSKSVSNISRSRDALLRLFQVLNIPYNVQLVELFIDLEMDEISDLSLAFKASTQCRFLRGVLATPSIFPTGYILIEELKDAQVRRLDSVIQSLQNTWKLINSRNKKVLSSLVLSVFYAMYLFEMQFSSTPATMMIGYEFAQSNSKLLSRSQEASSLCLNGAYSEEVERQNSIEMSVSSVVRTQKIKIGFLSSYWYNHSVGRLITDIIMSLDPDHFEVCIIDVSKNGIMDDDELNIKLRRHLSLKTNISRVSTGSSRQRQTSTMATEPLPPWVSLPIQSKTDILLAERLLKLYHKNISSRLLREEAIELGLLSLASPNSPEFILTSINLIRSLKLDVVVYPELGMNMLTIMLAQHRLADTQLVFWGHPISQGLPATDYFISSHLFEGESNASSLRREQTVLLDGLTSRFSRPAISNSDDLGVNKTTVSGGHSILLRYGIRVDKHRRVYLCPHTIMKFSQGFDEVISGILWVDSNATVVLLYNPSQLFWFQKLYRRIQSHLLKTQAICRLQPLPRECADIILRVALIPKQPQALYYELIQNCDVVLDSFPFGMGVTALETFAFGVPVVTLPSSQTVPALVSGMVSLMNLSGQLIASNTCEYIIKATLAAGMILSHEMFQNITTQCHQSAVHKLLLQMRQYSSFGEKYRGTLREDLLASVGVLYYNNSSNTTINTTGHRRELNPVARDWERLLQHLHILK